MSSSSLGLRGARLRTVAHAAHHAVARRLQVSRARGALAVLATALLAASCGPPGTYCQSGPKYGTQCYSVDGQPGTNAPPNQGGSIYPYATSSRRAPNGQKP